MLCRKKDGLENFVIKLIAEALARVFSCEFCEIFENTRTFQVIFNTRVTNTHVKNVKKRVRSCPMRIFLFLKFYNFIKRIVSIYTVFFKKLKVHECRFENITISSSLHENDKILIIIVST